MTRRWLNTWPDLDENFYASSYLSVDARQSFFLVAYSASPAMPRLSSAARSKYPSTILDSDGNYLACEHTYKLTRSRPSRPDGQPGHGGLETIPRLADRPL